LLIAAAAAFVMLSFPLARGVQSLFERQDVQGVSIAVVGEMGEAEALSSFASNLKDISAYCTFVPADMESAMDMLHGGEVSAVLKLPENFVHSILTGENSPAMVHVSPNRPMEGILTVYAGQCAADMLSAAQGGIYAVLDALKESGGYTDNSVLEINMEYIKFTLGRENMYDHEELSAVEGGDVGAYYASSLMFWLLLIASVLYHPVLCPEQGAWSKRLRAAGCTKLQWAMGAVLPVLLSQCALAGIICAFTGEISLFALLSLGVFAGGFACLMGAAFRSEAVCSGACTAFASIWVFLAGGIVPSVLLPKALRESYIHRLCTSAMDCAAGEGSGIILALGLAMLAFSFALLLWGCGREERV